MTLLLLLAIQIFLYCKADGIEETSPHWENLECEPGHKYLFSEVTMTWEDARVECDLYGGWLVDINSLEEHNCLLRHGNSQGYAAWYHIDGNYLIDFSLTLFWPLRLKPLKISKYLLPLSYTKWDEMIKIHPPNIGLKEFNFCYHTCST